MSLQSTVYNLIFKRSSTYALAFFGAAFFFERAADGLADSIFDRINRGHQWKDIKHLYENKEEQ